MVRKTRRHTSSKKTKGIHSIPELRRSFEHIEEYVDRKIALKESKEQLVKDLRKEWSKVFFKELSKNTAEAMVSEKLSKKHTGRHRTLRKRGITSGGAGAQLANTATPIAGAPNDYTTRQGVYLAPGQIPDKAGHLPLSDGGKSNFGSYTQYVDKGFWNPEPGQSYDPVPGQPPWPVPPVGMGSNAVHFANAVPLVKGGSRNRSRKARRGGSMGALLSQAFSHPISASSPPSILQDGQDMWHGKQVGPSSDQVQRGVNYQLGAVFPKPVSF